MVTTISHFNAGTVVEENESHISRREKFQEGEALADIYPVFPGIEVIGIDFHSFRYLPVLDKQANILEINHCLAGRIECRMRDNCLQYIGEGDLYLSTLSNHSDSLELPLGYYKGMAVIIDLDAAASEIPKLLPGISINIHELADRFFKDDECFLIQSKDEIQHIFSGMYTIPAQARSIYYQIKVLELLVYLHYFDPTKEKQKSIYARQQADVIKQIQKKITGDLGRRYTIEELAQQYCISPTALKAYFKGVYGKSIAAYMKEYRIRQALSLLCKTDKSIADIALSVGYESQSKFGVVFKEIMKITPQDYRKKFTHKPNMT